MCDHLIGLKYKHGADGKNSEIDCISLVYRALEALDFTPPPFKVDWYNMGPRAVLRELETYAARIDRAVYDGDIALLAGSWPAFGVTWQNGILYINNELQRSDWKPVQSLSIRRSYRLRKTSSACSAAPKRNTASS